MRSFLMAIVVAAVVGVGAWWVLNDKVQQTVDVAFTTTGVRL